MTSLDRDDVEIVIDEHAHEADLIIHLREKDRQRVQFSAGPDGLHNLVSLVPFADTGILFSQFDAGVARQAASTNRIWRSSLGSEVRLNLTEQLPMPRLILAWNPLRLDRHVRTSKGLARLKDPAFAFRIRF